MHLVYFMSFTSCEPSFKFIKHLIWRMSTYNFLTILVFMSLVMGLGRYFGGDGGRCSATACLVFWRDQDGDAGGRDSVGCRLRAERAV